MKIKGMWDTKPLTEKQRSTKNSTEADLHFHAHSMGTRILLLFLTGSRSFNNYEEGLIFYVRYLPK